MFQMAEGYHHDGAVCLNDEQKDPNRRIKRRLGLRGRRKRREHCAARLGFRGIPPSAIVQALVRTA
jgi:hypothetical protein